MDTTQVITLVATSSLVSALLTQFVAWIREWWTASSKKRAHAAYLALRLAVLLEAYADDCADLISRNNNAETGTDQEFPDWDVQMPTLPDYPSDDEGWRSLDIELAGRALALRNRINGSQSVIKATIDFSIDYLESELDENVGERGLEAYKIAVDLRRKYRFGSANLIYDFTDTLNGAVNSARKAKEEARERSAKTIESWSARSVVTAVGE